MTLACRYDHPSFGAGIAYSDGKAVYWTNGGTHVPLGWFRHQGRDVACTVKGLNPSGDRLGVLVQADTNLLAWWEEYIPHGQGPYYGAWHAFSKRFITAAALVLPGGTERGTTLPWGAEGLRRYFCDPAAVNSTFVRQKHYGIREKSNPLTTSITVDTFEDGPLACEFPMYDSWGGPEENGCVLQGYFEGDSNVSSTSTVLWEYTVDQSTYPDFATYTAVDTTTTLATGGTAARRFGTRVTLNHSAGTTATPNGGPFVVRGLKEPATRRTHEFVIDVDNMDENARLLIQSDLESARDGGVPVRLQYHTYDTYVYVTHINVTATPAEQGGKEAIAAAAFSVTEVL